MKAKSLAFAAIAAAALGACATATPYSPAPASNARGYSDQQIEANRFQVQFAGNSLTDRRTVETYLLYRAAELTKQNGFDHFRVVRRDTDADTRIVPVGGAAYSPFFDGFFCDYRFFGPYAGYFYDPFRRPYYSRLGFYDPFWGGPVEFREQTSYIASAEIVMGKGPKPDDVAAFNADEVILNLSGQITRPEA